MKTLKYKNATCKVNLRLLNLIRLLGYRWHSNQFYYEHVNRSLTTFFSTIIFIYNCFISFAVKDIETNWQITRNHCVKQIAIGTKQNKNVNLIHCLTVFENIGRYSHWWSIVSIHYLFFISQKLWYANVMNKMIIRSNTRDLKRCKILNLNFIMHLVSYR